MEPTSESTAASASTEGAADLQALFSDLVRCETRLYNADEGRTYSMRSKEQAHDYRYFPDPDLAPLVVTRKFIEQKRAELPELPEARRERMIAAYELSTKDAETLTSSREFADRFENAAKTARSPRRVATSRAT